MTRSQHHNPPRWALLFFRWYKSNLRKNLPEELSLYDYSLDVSRIKGAFANYDTRHENWRYYHCD